MGRDWVRDLRHAARALRRTPAFTAMAVGTLGLAIGLRRRSQRAVLAAQHELSPLRQFQVRRVVDREPMRGGQVS